VGEDGADGDLVVVVVVESLDLEGGLQGFLDPGWGAIQDPGGG
jgi:hypothetical protein